MEMRSPLVPRRKIKISKKDIVLTIFLILTIISYFIFEISLDTIFSILIDIISIYLLYKLFIKVSRMEIGSDLKLFGLRILSVITVLFGVFILWSYFLWKYKELTMWIIFSFNGLQIGSIYHLIPFLILGFGFILLGLFMGFRFMLHSGSIIYLR